MKKGTLCLLRNEDICLHTGTKLESLNYNESYDLSNYEGYQFKGNYMLDVVAIYETHSIYNTILNFSRDVITWKPVGLSEKEKNIIEACKLLNLTYIARDRDGDLFAYPSNKLVKTVSQWTLETEDSTYLRIPHDYFTVIKWTDICPTSIEELV